MLDAKLSRYKAQAIGFNLVLLSDSHQRKNGVALYINLGPFGFGFNLSWILPDPETRRKA